MKRDSVLSRARPVALAAAVLTTLCVAPARAEVAYAFAEQTISGLSITPAAGTFSGATPVVTITSDSSTINGSGSSNSDPVDAPQAYLGAPPAAPQNDFAQFATFPSGPPQTAGTLPTSPNSFSRGDVLVVPTGASNSGSTVAESFLDGSGLTKNGTAASSYTASFSFTPTATTTLAIAYNYANDIYVATTGTGNASATYKFAITIKDASGAVVFSSTTDQTNLNLVAPPQGGEIIQNGSQTVTTGSLTAGNSYTLIFSGNANTSVLVAAVPEPGPMSLAAVGGVVATVIGVVRRRRRPAP
jgi:hypothetical protein